MSLLMDCCTRDEKLMSSSVRIYAGYTTGIPDLGRTHPTGRCRLLQRHLCTQSSRLRLRIHVGVEGGVGVPSAFNRAKYFDLRAPLRFSNAPATKILPR